MLALTVRNSIVRHCLGALAKWGINRRDQSMGPMLDDPCDDREEAELKSERSVEEMPEENAFGWPHSSPLLVCYVCVENVMTYDEVGDSGSDCMWKSD